MEVYATVDDVIDAYEQTIPDNMIRFVEGRLAAAHALLRRWAPGIDGRVTSGQVERALVKEVIVQMVIRVLRNPAGLRSETDGDYSYTRDTRAAGGALGLTDEELELLGVGRSTVSFVPNCDPALPDVWRPDLCPQPSGWRGRGW